MPSGEDIENILAYHHRKKAGAVIRFQTLILYDDLGRRTSLARGNGRNTSYGYDGGSRLTALTQALSLGTITATFAYDPSGGIKSRSTDTDILSSTAASNVSRTYSSNALNQYVQAGPIVLTHNANGNINRLGPQTFTYDVLNQLIGAQGAIYTAVGGTTFDYDPAGRMDRMTSPNGIRRWGRDGDDVIVETDGSGDVLGRYVYGPGDDEPLVWYDGPSTAAGDRRFLAQDERGSVVAVMDGAGGTVAINRYDDWGVPGQGNLGRFQYTGQRWVPELQAYDYKARIYSPLIGRFLQADPIGYGAGMNMYAYVGGDPVNMRDPSGLCTGSRIEGSCPHDTAGNATGVASSLSGGVFSNPRVERPQSQGGPSGALAGSPAAIGARAATIAGANNTQLGGDISVTALRGFSPIGSVSDFGSLAAQQNGEIVVTGQRSSGLTNVSSIRLPITGVPRSLFISDLGPIEGGSILSGEIFIRKRTLVIYIAYIAGRGTLRQGLGKAVETAKGLHLTNISITAFIANGALGRVIANGAFLQEFPGARVYNSGPLTNIEIPVP